jgi:hypothetical protein
LKEKEEEVVVSSIMIPKAQEQLIDLAQFKLRQKSNQEKDK